MSKRRAHSPNYRKFPWEQPDFDPQKIVAHLDKMPMGQADSEYWREEGYVDRRHKEYKRSSEESYHRRRPSPYHDSAHFEGRGEGPRHRDAYRENKGRYEDRRGPPKPAHNQHYAQRDPGWRRDQPDRDSRESYKDRSPIRKEINQQRGRGQQRRKVPLHTDTWTPSQDNPESNRSRNLDGSPQFGYGREKLHEHRFSADNRRGGFDRNARGPFEFEKNRMDPVMDPTEEGPPPRREQFSHSRERDFPPRPKSSRSLSREDQRGDHFEEIHRNEGYHEPRRSPIPRKSPSTFSQYTDRPTNRGRPINRGRGFNRRGGFDRKGRGRGAYSNRPNIQNAPEKMQSTQLTEEEVYYDEPNCTWEDEEPGQEWREDRRSSEGRGGRDEGDLPNFPRRELEMQQRPQELRGRNESKPNMMVITEETLTIKVDMSRPVNKNSAMLYSEDRQLSLDLVHVGRQRLDFLSASESRGSNRENAVHHMGTFAQEIITLTHLVKELYFGGEGITLNQRFAAPPKVAFEEEEPHEMTLSERFSSNRLNANSQTDSDDPLFTRQGPLQLLGSPMVRDPDDLRHDLEKRRQERLEGVKVTIAGQTLPQRPQPAPPVHNSEQTFSRNEDVLEEAEFSNWSEEPQRRQGPMGPRRGGPFPSNGAVRRNIRQMKRPNYRNNNNNNGGNDFRVQVEKQNLPLFTV